jgi:hypothetical protein
MRRNADSQTWLVTDISIENPINEPFCLIPKFGVPEFWRLIGIVVSTEDVGRGGGLSVVGLYAATPLYVAPGAREVVNAAWLFAWYTVTSACTLPARKTKTRERHKVRERKRRHGADSEAIFVREMKV